jgi:hypothetical protein
VAGVVDLLGAGRGGVTAEVLPAQVVGEEDADGAPHWRHSEIVEHEFAILPRGPAESVFSWLSRTCRSGEMTEMS